MKSNYEIELYKKQIENHAKNDLLIEQELIHIDYENTKKIGQFTLKDFINIIKLLKEKMGI